MRPTSTLAALLLLQPTFGQPGSCDGFVAGFSTDLMGLSVQFNNTTEGSDGQTIWQWNLGDGNSSAEMEPEHTYAEAGTYTVCLVAVTVRSNPNGQPITCVDEHCLEILVNGGDPCDGLEACFQASQLASASFFFNNCSSPSLNSTFLWTFGDGSTSAQFAPIHTYELAGIYTVCLVTTWPGGCIDEVCSQVTVGSDPCADFEACFVINALPQSGAYFFDNCTSGPANAQFVWDFGDGGTSTETNVDHQYEEAGTYEVCLTAYYGTCTDDTCTLVIVGPADPCTALVAGFVPLVSGLGVNFSNATTGAGTTVSFAWDLGDGNTSNDPQPFHAYAAPGTYEVCLSVLSTYEVNGQLVTCSDEHCQAIVVGENPCDDLVACFEALPFENGAFLFENCSQLLDIAVPASYLWNFGDGTTSDEEQPDHSFAPGTYAVCLTVTHGDCVDEFCMSVTVEGGDPCAQLVADFNYAPTGLSVQFISNTAGASPQSIFTWTFGDGGTGQGPNPVHVYAEQGVYVACLRVESVYAFPGQPLVTCVDEICYDVDAGFSKGCEGLVACFEALPFENGAYLFENCSQLLDIAIPASYFWNFGDGTTSTEAQPDHSFAPGTYTICLTVTQGECVDEFCMSITVEGGDPCNELNVDFVPLASGLGVNFSNVTTGTGSQTSWSWTFGDGGSSTDPQPFHTYANPGTYQVCLVVTSIYPTPNGGVVTCVEEHCEQMLIVGGEECNPDYATEFTWTAQGTAVVFSAFANAPTVGFIWDFGDGTESAGQVVTHLYEPPGPYEVCLSAWYYLEAIDDTCWAYDCRLLNPFTVGLADAEEAMITAFPVPATAQLTITGLTANTQLSLFANDGRLVLNTLSAGSTQTLDLRGLAKGGYVLRIGTGHGNFHRQVIVE